MGRAFISIFGVDNDDTCRQCKLGDNPPIVSRLRSALLDFARAIVRVASGPAVFYRLCISPASRCLPAYLRNVRGSRCYQNLTEADILETRKSDTVFIFGSGYSINEIGTEEWVRMGECDTISLREFPRQSFVRADYHVSAEVDDMDEYAELLRSNPLYSQTIFVVQKGYSAISGNNLIGKRLLTEGRAVFRFKRRARGRCEPPSRSFSRGLVHGHGSLIGIVNFAYLMGWKKIVLVGIDMYDKRYFWLGPSEGRSYEKPSLTPSSSFPTANPIIDCLGKWRTIFEKEAVSLFVYNPRSLLSRVLPVYRFPQV